MGRIDPLRIIKKRKKENKRPSIPKRVDHVIERDEAIAREYRETHETIPDLPADKMYKVDPTFSRRPTAVCGNTLIGLPCCEKGMGKHCYCKIPCSSQYKLGSTDISKARHVSIEVKKLEKEEMEAAIQHAHEVMKTQRPEVETNVDLIVKYLLESIADESQYKRKE